MKNFFQKYRSFNVLSAGIVLSVFITFITINTFTLHIHVLDDGTQVVHSHLVNSNESSRAGKTDSHSHTKSEFDQLLLISLLLKSFIFITIALFIKVIFYRILFEFISSLLNKALQIFYKLRAPPFYI